MDTAKTTRRRLLAGIPALAATMAPAAATALSGLPAGDWRTEAAFDVLAKLPADHDQARPILQCLSDCFTAGDAYDAYMKTYQEIRTSMIQEDSTLSPGRIDEEIEESADKQIYLTDEILAHHPVLREGLALQCRAIIMHGFDDPDRVRSFVAAVAAFLYLDLPRPIAEDLFARREGDEDYEDEEDEAA